MLFVLGFLLGLVLGLLGGGSLDHMLQLRFRWPIVVVAIAAVRFAILATPLNRVEGAQYAYALSLVVLVAWTAWHVYRVPGIWLVTAGAALNLVVIVANSGRMPVAQSLAGILVHRGQAGQYTLMGSGTHLNALGDWVSISPFPEAYSVGDLLIALGIALVVLIATHRTPEPAGNNRETSGRIVSDPP